MTNKKKRITIGGSDVATIMGVNKYQSPLELWQILTGRRIKEDLSKKESVEAGLLFEEPLTKHFLKEWLGLEFKPENYQWEYKNKDDYRRGTLDYLIDDETMLEIKTAGEYLLKDWEDGVPEYYLWQAYHYMDIFNLKRAYFGALVGGNKFFMHLVERTARVESLITLLREKVAEFYQMVIDDIEPEIILRTVEPAEEKNMDQDVQRLAESYLDLNAQIKTMNGELDTIKTGLREMIGENTVLTGIGVKASYKNYEKETVDWKAIVRDHNIDVDAYKTMSVYSRLDIRKIKEKK